MKRVMQLLLTGIFGLAGLGVAVSALVSGHVGAAAAGLVPLVMAVVFYGIFEIQIRSFARAGAEVRKAIEACSRSVFEAPGRLLEGYDLDATTTSALVAGFAREANNDAAFTTEGAYRDAKVSVASHVSVVGRQMGEFHHTYSHVLVDVLGLDRPFRISREGAAAKVAKAMGAMTDVSVGDEGFDKTFMVGTDDAFAKAVLDDGIRRRLLELQSKVKNVSIDSGVGCMSVTLTKKGLALRWPGDITPELAIFIRDLLLDMRANMLAYENRTAARVGAEATAGAGYRLAVDDEEAPAEVEARNAAG
jgi:hypothetical protein